MTMADVERAGRAACRWGTAGGGHRAHHRRGRQLPAPNKVQISLNRGALPHEMFMEQIRRFAREVLPALQAHRVERVPLVEEHVD